MKKIICIILAMVMVFAFVTSAFADTVTYTNMRVYGGSSQQVYTNNRVNSSTIDVTITSYSYMQSGFKFRGYNHANGSTCTALSTVITGNGDWHAGYTSFPTVVTVKMSITSSDPTVYLVWSGTIDA